MVTEKSDKLIETLQFYHDMYDDKVVLTTAWGYSGMVLLDHARSVWDRVPVVSVDTGFLFPETLAFAKELGLMWNLNLLWSGPVKSDQMPPTQECCDERKLMPFRKLLEPYQAWVTALRHDQATTRRDTREVEVDAWSKARLSPMLKWTYGDCWKYIRENDVPVQPLHAKGYRSIGCQPCTNFPNDDERSGRWNGTRAECGIHKIK